MQVIKRDNTMEDFQVEKIKKVIKWATEGLNVNPLELEAKTEIIIKDGMKTNDIQQSLINQALAMTDIKNLEWRFVAARLKLMNIYKAGTDLGYGDFVKESVDKKIYDDVLTDFYNDADFKAMESFINLEYDKGFDYAGMNLLENRYLMDGEIPQYMFATVALMLAIPERTTDRIEVAKKFYTMLADRKLSLATPLLLNLRRPNGNLASCFITQMHDSLEDIYGTLTDMARISKNAGGVGVNISNVRSLGATIKQAKGASGGVVPWIKLINDTAVAVNQLGSRSGAITVALDVWHKDINEFLELQTENGDQRRKAYDIFPQIVVPDLFMDRVEKDGNWTLFDPHEFKKITGKNLVDLYGLDFELEYINNESNDLLKLKKTVKAKDLFKQILKTVVETGMPYVFFKDTTNYENMNEHSGMIYNANLCTESFSNFNGKDYVHTCNLVSLNLGRLLTDEELDEAVSIAVRLLDNAIELTEAPIDQSDAHNNDYRILGIGAMGLADWLVAKNLKYSNLKDIDDLFCDIHNSGVEASQKLGQERGNYKYFEGSKWEERGYKNMRNGGLFAIAPNTSTSLLMGSTASILPPYKKFYVDKASNGAVPVCPPFLSQDNFWKYKEVSHYDQKQIIDVVSIIQKHIDQGISMELTIDLNKGLTAKDIYNLYFEAWKKRLKTVYYVRSIALGHKEDCASCSG